MKSLVLLLLGGVAGAVATVMFFSIDPSFESQGSDGPGGGNVRISMDEYALAAVLQDEMSAVEELGAETVTTVTVNPNGLIDVSIGVGITPVGLTIDLLLDPEVVEGELVIVVVEASAGELVAPEILAGVIEEQLQRQLRNAAGGFEYRLTSITTTDGRLTLEIEI